MFDFLVYIYCTCMLNQQMTMQILFQLNRVHVHRNRFVFISFPDAGYSWSITREKLDIYTRSNKRQLSFIFTEKRGIKNIERKCRPSVGENEALRVYFLQLLCWSKPKGNHKKRKRKQFFHFDNNII